MSFDFWDRLISSPEWNLIVTIMLIVIAFFAILICIVILLMKISRGTIMGSLIDGVNKGVATNCMEEESSQILSAIGNELGANAKGLVIAATNLARIKAVNEGLEANAKDIKDVNEEIRKEVNIFAAKSRENAKLSQGSSFSNDYSIQLQGVVFNIPDSAGITSSSDQEIEKPEQAETGIEKQDLDDLDLEEQDILDTQEDSVLEIQIPIDEVIPKVSSILDGTDQVRHYEQYAEEAFVRYALPEYKCLYPMFRTEQIEIKGDWSFIGENCLSDSLLLYLYRTFNQKKSEETMDRDNILKIFNFLSQIKKERKL